MKSTYSVQGMVMGIHLLEHKTQSHIALPVCSSFVFAAAKM
jgi:hypothetical protein